MKILILSLLLFICRTAWGQMVINDESIRYQQERMVFKQWNKDKFTPKPGFLSLNPLYWLTWAWHADYKNKDLRPLGPAGPQTQRLAFVAAMQNTENAYKLQADTLRNTAITETANYSGELSVVDPLWLLYYRNEFDPLINQLDGALLNRLAQKEKDYLTRTGVLEWYLEESHALAERLDAARGTTVDRGSRIIAYHRLLAEYRKLMAAWDTARQRAKLYLSLSESAGKVKRREEPIKIPPGHRTDKQIADDVLSKSKL